MGGSLFQFDQIVYSMNLLLSSINDNRIHLSHSFDMAQLHEVHEDLVSHVCHLSVV